VLYYKTLWIYQQGSYSVLTQKKHGSCDLCSFVWVLVCVYACACASVYVCVCVYDPMCVCMSEYDFHMNVRVCKCASVRLWKYVHKIKYRYICAYVYVCCMYTIGESGWNVLGGERG